MIIVQSQGRQLRMVLYNPETMSLRGGEADLLPLVCFPMGAKEEQQPPTHHQDEALGESFNQYVGYF